MLPDFLPTDFLLLEPREAVFFAGARLAAADLAEVDLADVDLELLLEVFFASFFVVRPPDFFELFVAWLSSMLFAAFLAPRGLLRAPLSCGLRA